MRIEWPSLTGSALIGSLIVGSMVGGCADNNSPMVVRHRAMLAEQRGDDETALAIRDEFLKEFPDYYFITEVHFEQGMTYFDNQQYERAIECFDRALAEDPEFLIVYVRRCEARMRLGQYAEAIADGNEAIRLSVGETDLAAVFLAQANASAELGMDNEAVVKWQLSLLANPNELTALERLFTSYLNAGDQQRARQLIERSLAQNDQFAIKHWLHCQLLKSQGQLEEARKALARARELDLGDSLELPESIEEIPEIAVFEQAPVLRTAARPVVPSVADQTVETKIDAAVVPDSSKTENSPELAIADRAIALATEFLEQRGYQVANGSDGSQGMMTCEIEGRRFDVMIKSVMPADQGRFILTADDLETINAQTPPKGMLLVGEFLIDPQTSMLQKQSGRVVAFTESWQPDESRLVPLTYEYRLPSPAE